MRARLVLLLSVASTTLGAGLVACVDLFHSTGDILTACELDAQTPGCSPEAGVEAGVDAGNDFCGWSEGVALANAQHACAWLGACESPLGRNAYGACLFEALLAYDCGANPNHPVKGKTHALWDCLWQANSCAAVDACVFPQGLQQCMGGGFVACATQEGGINADVRVECGPDGGAARGENCALWGQTCGGDLSEGVCSGSRGQSAIACSTQGCDGTMLHACNDAGLDIGIDCAGYGAQQCGGEPPGQSIANWVACVPASDAGTCTASTSVACDGGIATSCPAGLPESVNCQVLLGNVHACASGTLSPVFDWTSPCTLVASDSDGGDDAGGGPPACVESCSGTTLTACYRGASFSLDCSKPGIGLGPCQMRTTDQGTMSNAACTAPPPP